MPRLSSNSWWKRKPAGRLSTCFNGCSRKPEDEKQEIYCPVCMEECNKINSMKLSACKHSLCKDCARTLVLESIRNGKIPILCPICLAEPDTCPKCLHFKETMPPQVLVREPSARAVFAPLSLDPWLGFLFGSPTSAPAANSVEMYANGVDYWCCNLDADVPQLLSKTECMDYSHRSLQAAVAKGGDLLPCPQTDCPGIAVRGNEDNGAVCNACSYCWCVGCGAAWHAPKTCAQHLQEVRQQHEIMAEQHFTSYKAVQMVRRCSSCGHGLEKIGGCDHVTCAGCRRMWKYSTLPRAV